jgi:CHAT domain-containing protein
MPTTPGATDLPDSQREANYLMAGNPDGRVLAGPEATRGAVLSAIPYSTWIHFACHGVQDRAQPSRSRLLLHDGPLTIQEIAASRADQAELAYLSACETFSGGTDLPDESITLATAVQLAGYRHVIGAQWPVADGVAPEMARRVYAGIRENGPADTALAVHDAVRALRRDWPDSPAAWAPYVHVGP